MPSGNNYEELDVVLAKLADDRATEADLGELEGLLLNDSEAQARYLRYLDLHETLGERLSSTNSPSAGVGKPMILLLPQVAFLLAGMALVASCLWLLWPNSAPAVATLVEYEGPIRWTGDAGQISHRLEKDQKLHGGTLEVRSADAWVEVRFLDGSKLSLAGRSSLTLSDREGRKFLALHHGNLSVEAAPQPPGKPMHLETPSADIEVVGTQFNVQTDSLRTELAVNEGRVRVTRRSDGRVEEVLADQLVVAELEQATEFRATERPRVAHSWTSEFPRDLRFGSWEAPRGSVAVTTHLWRGDQHTPSEPILLHSMVADPSAGTRPPLVLEADTVFTVRGTLERNHAVNLGITTHRRKGGFSGKYSASRMVELAPDLRGDFELRIRLADLKPTRERFPSSPAGHEVAYLWVQTIRGDADLRIQSIALAPERP